MKRPRSNILIVDDELPVCKSIASALVGNNYNVDTALSGEEAFKKGVETNYDIVIADLMMPGISGMELLGKVKEKNPNVSVIIITGYPSIKTAVQAIKLGAFDYIPKPFTPQELRSLVSRAVAMDRVQTVGRSAAAQGSAVKEYTCPVDLYCIPNNTWVKIEKDGTVRIGVHHMMIQVIKDIVSIELPKINEMRYQGEACIVLHDDQQRLHRLWTPVSGRVTALNEVVRENYSILISDPYGEGWLLMMSPLSIDTDLKNLISTSTEH